MSSDHDHTQDYDEPIAAK